MPDAPDFDTNTSLIMSFGGQPYIHCPPPRQSGYAPQANTFDPKAYTRASFAPRSSQQAKSNGSLLDFNRHPDSYVIQPYGQTNAIPMGPNTKRNVKIVRWLQFVLRILNMLGALGMLVCVICLTNMDGTEGWVIRLIPAADILCTSYALYHLFRGVKSRTPASSASYHWFAFLTDACFIPLYIYTVIIDRSRLAQSSEADDRWRSLFKNGVATVDLMTTTWIDSIVLASIHLVCCCNSVYLACTFRKIANLPPDMNPLEDNLTSRRRAKHKHKNSELLASEKHNSAMSFVTSGRSSPVKVPAVNERPVSFIGTRAADATQLYSPHNPLTANASRTHLPLISSGGTYSQPHSAQVSRADFASQSSPPKSKTAGLSRMLSAAASSIYSRSSNGEPTPPLPRKSSKRTSGTFDSSNNWYTIHEDGDEDGDNHAPSISIIEEDSDDDDIFAPPRDDNAGPSAQSTRYYAQKYRAVPQPSQLDQDTDDDLGTSGAKPSFTVSGFEANGLHMDPLHMNPPTPPPGARPASQRQRERKQVSSASTPHNPMRALAATSGNASRAPPLNSVATAQQVVDAPITKVVQTTKQSPAPTPVPARDSPSPSKQKGMYYGDLASAVSGVRNTPPHSPSKTKYAPAPASRGLNQVEPGWGIGAWLAGVGPGTTSTNPAAPSKKHGREEMGGGDAFFEDVVLPGSEPNGDRLGVAEARMRQGDARRRVSGKVVEEGLAPSTAARWGGERQRAQVGRGIRVVDDGVTGKRWDGRGRVISRSGVDVG